MNYLKKLFIYLFVLLTLTNIVFCASLIYDNKSSLNIYSDFDNSNQIFYSHQKINFYANFKNISSNLSYQTNANCYFKIPNYIKNYTLMNFNISNNLYHFNTSFILGGNYIYDIKCNSTNLNLNTLNTSSKIFIFPNSELEVFDQSINSSFFPRKNKPIKIYANYSSRITKQPILNSLCQIEFENKKLNLTYNNTNKLYEIKINFTKDHYQNYKINCTNLNYSNSIYINSIYNYPLFYEIENDFTGLRDSSIIVGDFNNNGYDEIIFTGNNLIENKIFAYEYINQTFKQINTNIKEFSMGSISTADFNNDGYLDLITCGKNSSNEPQTNLYINNKTDLILTKSNIENLVWCSISTGDFNNDGKIDFIITGLNSTNYFKNLIYENLGESFSNQKYLYLNMNYPKLTIISDYRVALQLDYNLDGYNDLLFCGNSGNNFKNCILLENNKNNSFSNKYTISNLDLSSSVYFLTNSTYINFLIFGKSDTFPLYPRNTKIYSYNQTNIVNTQNLVGFSDGSAISADFNNNGFEDLFLIGINSTNKLDSKIYFYNGSKFYNDNLELTKLSPSSTLLYDFNDDGALDLFVLGLDNTNLISKLYQNTISYDIINQKPQPTQNISYYYNYSSKQLYINWSKSQDDITPQNNLYYNLQIGTIENKYQILSGLPLHSSNPVNGYKGNMFNRNFHILNIKPGNYIIEVQTIDSGLRKSAFSSITTNFCNYNGSLNWIVDGICILNQNITIQENSSIIVLDNSFLKLINSKVNLLGQNSSIEIYNSNFILNSSQIKSNSQINFNLTNNSELVIENSQIENLNFNLNCSTQNKKISFANSQIINSSFKLVNCEINFTNIKLNDNFFNLTNSELNLINSSIQNYTLNSNSQINFYSYLNILSNTNNILINYNSINYPEINNSFISNNPNLNLKILSNTIGFTLNKSYSNYSFNFKKLNYFDKNYILNLTNNTILNINLELTGEPDYTSFKYEPYTTNFTNLSLNRNLTIKNAIIGKFGNYINFTNQINFTNLNLNDAIKISKNSIYINSNNYSILNSSAILVFNNLSYTKTPIIFKNGIICNTCYNINYSISNKRLSFEVNSFSNYSISQNSKLIYIDKNLVCNTNLTNSILSFKYLNLTNSPILNSNCLINISTYTNYLLNYNSLENIFYFNNTLNSGNYNLTVFCNTTNNYEKIIYNDTIYIKKNNYDILLNQKNTNIENIKLSAMISLENGVLISGTDNTEQSIIKYYQIENKNFIENNTKISSIIDLNVETDLPPVFAVFDFDNDGDEDLLLIKKLAEDSLNLYENLNGIFILKQNLGKIKEGSIDIADFNKDGNLDILTIGRDINNNFKTVLYLNNKTNFVKINFSFEDISQGSALFLDYNNDNYPDIIINGLDSTKNTKTLVYKNINGTNFELDELISNQLSNSYFSSISIGDINNDNFFDLIIDGFNVYHQPREYLSNIYLTNSNNLTFHYNLTGTIKGSNLFANLNLDNTTDLIRAGQTKTNPITEILFNVYSNSNLKQLNSLKHSSILALDYDEDGDLDLIISGLNTTNQPQTIFYENDATLCVLNPKPTTPSISAYYNQTTNKLHLNWSNSIDLKGGSLTYNLRVGNYNNPNKLLSGVVSKTTKPNNAGYGNQRFSTSTILDIPKQCFKIQIQSIDNSYQKSNWSQTLTLSFTEIKGDGLDQDCDGIDPPADGGQVEITTGGSNSGGGAGGGGTSSINPNSVKTSTSNFDYYKEIIENQDDNNDENTQNSNNDNNLNFDNINENTQNQNSNSKSSQEYSVEKSIEKIFEDKNVFGHTRKISYSNENTLIREEIKNKYIFPIENISINITIPKEIIQSASKEINWKKTSNFRIIEDDPIIGYEIKKIDGSQTYYLDYELKTKISIEEANLIVMNLEYENSNLEQKKQDFAKLINETKKHIIINQTYKTDLDSNTTKYTLDLDFDDQSILYNVSVYHEIPKCLIHYLNENFIDSNYDFEIVDEDPLIVWHFDKITKDEKIEFAILSVADDDCNDLSQTFAIAKSIFISNKKINYGPYKTSDGKYYPGITLSIIILFLITLMLFYFASFSQTKNDKLRLAMFIQRVNYYKKNYQLSEFEIKNNLISDGATLDEIDEIFTKNIFKRLFVKFEIAFEEILLFTFIIINIFDFLEILPGDFDLIKKIISWTFLSYVFYQISVTKLLFGVQKKLYDIIILFAFYLLILKNFIIYSIGAVQYINYFVDFIILIVRNSTIIEETLFFSGLLIIFLISIIITIKIDITTPSVLSLIKYDFNQKYLIKFIIVYLSLMLFFTTIYNLSFEWLAIAIDAPLVTICIIGYFILLVKRHQKFYFTDFLYKLGNGLNTFYKEILNLFTQKNLFILGITSFLILSLLTELGNFILPYLTGQGDSLYFGAVIADYSISNLIRLIESGHAPIFSIKDFFGGVNSLYTYQLLDIENMWVALNLLMNYIFNIIFIILLIILPAYIWYQIYKSKKDNKYYINKVIINKWILALFLFSGSIFIFNPAFSFGFINQSSYTDILIEENVIKGIDIRTNLINPEFSFIPIIIGLFLIFFVFISKKSRYVINNFSCLLILFVFATYILAFYYQLQIYYIDLIKQSLLDINFKSILITFNFALMYLLTIIFYIGGLLLFVYELWKDDEIPFEEKYDENDYD